MQVERSRVQVSLYGGVRLACLVAGLAWMGLGLAARPALAPKVAPKVAAEGSASTQPSGMSLGPVPKWVEPVTPDFNPADTSAPQYIALKDKQVRLDADGVSSYLHQVRVLRQPSGVEQGSQIQIEYDPAYQSLVVHQLAIWRDGKRIDKLSLKAFKVLQRETQLERLMYDGRVTASAVLDDVRVNDRIELAYTLKGQNPVFGGKFVELDWGASSAMPMAFYRYRLLTPSGRRIQHRFKAGLFTLSTRALDAATTETIVQRHNSPLVAWDNAAPPVSYLDDGVQWSEFNDWADVAAWADQLFGKAVQSTDAVKAQLADLTGLATSDEARVEKVLDFVQSDIRYFGTEVGVSSHLPADAQTVLRQRYGDCKDKAALLVSLLRAAGMKATPVLVSTAYRDDADAWLPSPLVFDHAIAQLRLGDKTYWLDGTRGRQAGVRLAWRNAEGLGKVLLAEAGQTALTRMPGTAEVLRLEGQDVFHFTRLSEPPSLEASQTYHGEMAEMVRNALANQSVEDLQKNQFAAYPRTYPHIQQLGAMQVQDDLPHNALTLRVSYLVPDFLRFPQQRALVGDFALFAMIDPLRVSSQAPRTRPLYLWYQGTYRHAVDFQFDQEVYTGPSSNRFDEHNDFFDLHTDISGTQKTMHVGGELQQITNTVDPQDWSRYKDVLTKVWPRVANVVIVPAIPNDRAEALRRDATVMAEDFKRGKSEFKSLTQFQSRMQIMGLEAALQADRLPSKPRAEALDTLGESYNLLRQFDEGRDRFTQALKLDPQNASAHLGLAFSGLGHHDYAVAEREATQAMALEPNEVSHHLVKAQALYYQQKYPDARAELLEMLKSRTERERSYGALWLYMTALRLGEDGKAAVRPYMPSGSRPAWPYAVLQHLMGELDLAQAERGTVDGDKPDPGRLCEWYYFLGENALLQGGRAQARAYFNQSIGTGILEFQEYGFSQRELALLGP